MPGNNQLNSTIYTLENIRQAFTDSYIRGDVEMLRFIEHESFFSLHNKATVSRDQQYRNTSRRISVGKWFPPKTYMTEENLIFTKDFDLTFVSGQAKIILNNQILNTFRFLECWLPVENNWKILWLTYEDFPPIPG
jgi:hypothetical protein